jgi:hypothetical protein
MKRESKAMRHGLLATAVVIAAAGNAVAQDPARDPRVGLRAGFTDAGVAARNMELLSNTPRSEGFATPGVTGDMRDILFANSDLAFQGNTLFMGSFRGFQIYDVSNPRSPQLISKLVCPGGQGDVSVYRNLLFMSVEMPNARLDCQEGEMSQTPSKDRFLGIRIFDVSDIKNPKQVGQVQTCRGSHTHTLVTDPNDTAHVYIYVSGASGVRPAAELAGCSGAMPKDDPNTSRFRIEVIQVPVNAPQNARVVNAPRIFANAQTGDIAGLWPGGAHGPGTQQTAPTDQCHDITAFPEMGIAAGACSGNGILLRIVDPANPTRVKEISDPNFAYWHSATFNNYGTKVVFTDEWGGGMAPYCKASDPKNWGANAIFDIVNGELKLGSYYKLPAPQSATENCVAHNGSIIPVPGRDIMVQAWYQGGISVFDFTDSKNPVEIAYFDRGPQHTALALGGHWSAYWYNGVIFASEITRGLDVLTLKPSEHLTQNEIDAAKSAVLANFNPQTQTRIIWPASFAVARAYLDQLKRGNGLTADQVAGIARELDRIESLPRGRALIAPLTQLADRVGNMQSTDAARISLLSGVIRDLSKRE